MKKSSLVERHLVVEETEDWGISELRRRLFLGEGCEGGFTNVCAPTPPKFDSRLLVLRKGSEVMVAVLVSTFAREVKWEGGRMIFDRGGIEVVFDLRNDGFGFTQFVFQEGRDVVLNEFAPYPEARVTSRAAVSVKRWGWEDGRAQDPSHFRVCHALFFAVFDAAELFQFGPTIGFNVCRSDAYTGDFSAWSFLAGHGAPDANSLGKLHRDARTAARERRQAPLYPAVKNFRVSITNDSPMMICNRAYTPEGLDAEMRALGHWGVRRLHWIDYSNFPSFWRRLPLWRDNYPATLRACGEDVLAAVCRAARKRRIELVPDFKPFDLSFLVHGGDSGGKGVLPGFDGARIAVIPEMLDSPDAFMQTNPAWRRAASFPIHTLRLFSTGRLPDPRGLRVSQSADNITYKRVRVGRVVVKKVSRPNRRWTPAGIENAPGKQSVWRIEISGLSISKPFVRVEIPGADGSLVNRHFALIEAVGQDGSEAPFLCSDSRPLKADVGQFDFFGKWPGWNNYNDHAWQWSNIRLADFGIALIEPPVLTGLLEPTHPKAQKIWLDRVDYYLDHDVAGVSIRTLCHHRRCPSWLQYAFAPSALAAFQKKHGRLPKAQESDYARMRVVRGEAMGDFLSAAAAKIRAKRKKSIFQIEAGGELPPERESRMAMFYDYEKWIGSGLFDELHVRSITGHSPWLRQVILPLAKKHGVETHLMSRNWNQGFGAPDLLNFQRIVRDAKKLGYDGLNFYESASLYEITEAESLLPRAMGEVCVREAVRLAKAPGD